MGDDVCWLSRTCLACGRFLEGNEAEEDECPHCGAEMLPPPPAPSGPTS